jgi:hypothetical protein
MERVIAQSGISAADAAVNSNPRAASMSARVERIMESLLLAHIVVVAFQVLLRAMVFDMTYYRDILLLASLALWGVIALGNPDKRRRVKMNLLDRLVAMYLFYGILTTLIAYFINNVPLLAAATQFRNNFLPLSLFFVAKRAFASAEARARLINLLVVLGLIFIADALIEFLALQIGLSPFTLPWYRYMFRVQNYFIGSEANSPNAYLLPENTPALGLLGFPNFTVPALMALFAFSYPFLVQRFKGVRAGLVGLMALIAVLVFNVQTHLVSGLLVMLVLPALIQPKSLKRNLLILAFASLLLIAFQPLRASLVSSAQLRFLGDQVNRSHLDVILDKNQAAFIVNSPLPSLLFGSAFFATVDTGEFESWEFRLLLFTATYGLCWLVLFLGIYALGFVYAFRLFRIPGADSQMRLFGVGAIGLLAVYILEMGHYARTMWAPNIDIWVVVVGTVSALITQLRLQKSKVSLQRMPTPGWSFPVGRIQTPKI